MAAGSGGTNQRVHVLELVAGSLGDVAQAEDGAVWVDFFIVSAPLQVEFITCFQDV